MKLFVIQCFFRILLLVVVVVGNAFLNTSAHSDNVFDTMENHAVLDLEYHVYSSGFFIATQNLRFAKVDDKLHIQSRTQTSPAISWLQDTTIILEVIETITKEKNYPLTFRTNITSSSLLLTKESASYVNYNKNDLTYGYVPIANIDEDDHPDLFDEKYTQNTTNWLSFISSSMNFYKDNPQQCAPKNRIFDVGGGVELTFRSPKIVDIATSDFTPYRGKALKCSVIFKPVPSKGQSPSPSSVGDIVIAKIIKDFYLPTRFFIASSSPRVIMHLKNYNLHKTTDFEALNLLPDIPLPSPQ